MQNGSWIKKHYPTYKFMMRASDTHFIFHY